MTGIISTLLTVVGHLLVVVYPTYWMVIIGIGIISGKLVEIKLSSFSLITNNIMKGGITILHIWKAVTDKLFSSIIRGCF